ncbi:heme-binding domain-containing protein [Reichenbachiella carrageenanivorans]|uniref:Heme-binding domain-containing protein n=1 Tax=Reichenbachiella carrageenanivorans TaxID=2979869 RepID=A0ABY6CXE6_9BACT|nr:heme-binding domain-containing protein [Reichenbachiella carrageenanivorans]UXX78580.1 heme-binding domain-containing protein [Reichenbachiella carrageenanivorans]
MTIKTKIIIGLLTVLVFIQFFGFDNEIPAYEAKNDFITMMNPPAEIAQIIKTSCYDCHSYETKYPWYASVAPVSWWIGDHIEDGRKHFNLSTWGTYTEKKALHKLEEFYEEVEKGEMPLSSYTILHGDASLSPEQVSQLVTWVKSLPGVEAEH